MMSAEDNVVRQPFPPTEPPSLGTAAQKPEESGVEEHSVFKLPTAIDEEERARRVMRAATDYARPDRPAGEWRLWYKRKAEELGVPPEQLEDLILALIKDHEKKAAATLAEQRLAEQRAERLRKTDKEQDRKQERIEDVAVRKAKIKAKAFADLLKLPAEQHEDMLVELAKKIDEDIGALREEFADYCGSELPSESEWGDVDPWPEPVAAAALLEELITRINAHIKAEPYQVLAAALWILMSWVHEAVAHYSVYLVATAPKEDCGKTTLVIEVIGGLAPKAYACGSDPTASNIFRTADREKPTMLFDNVDTLFDRRREVTELFLTGWTRGPKIPRQEKIGGEWQTVWYDPFCPKACTLIGTKIPKELLTRCLLIEMWPLKPGETVLEVDPFDQELMEAFKTLRRKALRWSIDSASALKGAKPLFPAGFPFVHARTAV
jgi:hypothetical protein